MTRAPRIVPYAIRIGVARGVSMLGLCLVSLGCMKGMIWIETPPEPPEPVVPTKLERTSPPRLAPTEIEGILEARDSAAPLYFDESSELWYRYWRGRWYQAFSWNGAWFTPERVPPDLRRSRQIEEAEGPGDPVSSPPPP